MGQLGFEKLTYLLRYLWRFHGFRLGKMNGKAHCEKEENKLVLRLGMANGSNSRASEPTDSMQPSNSEKKESGKSLVQAAQLSLLLGEEIGKFISILQSSTTTQLDLYNEWEKILPLFHSENNVGDSSEINSLFTLHGRSGTARKFIDTDIPTIEMKKEALWMLKFLTQKACSHLREGLDIEQGRNSYKLS